MSNRRIIVLKFGGSVLRDQADVHRVVQEIYRWRRDGYQVVAVVSAIGNTTDVLSSRAHDFGPDADPQKIASFLSTGERQAASLTGLALDRAGISNSVCDEVSIGLKSDGHDLDATLVGVDSILLHQQLQRTGVVVLPGFVGQGKDGQLQLLGRGGSDLTALFLAVELNAVRCRLVKDVDGLYEYDPQLAADGLRPRRFKFVTFEDALCLDESIVQHKAVRYARDADMPFEVASIFSTNSSRVGRYSCSSFALELQRASSNSEQGSPGKRLRVALLGLGTVGLGVYRQLIELFDCDFEVVSVAVRDKHKAVQNRVPHGLLTDNAFDAIDSDCDVVVELVGGDEQAGDWLVHALQNGKHVVSANKSLIANKGIQLQAIAEKHHVKLLYSAAVGGVVPVLETVRQLAATDEVLEVNGILNGTTNFILDEIAGGATLPQAVVEAGNKGLAEQDAGRDIHGIDAAEKLVLIARECGNNVSVKNIQRDRLDEIALIQAVKRCAGATVRQLATLVVSNSTNAQPSATVRLVPLQSESIFSEVRGSGNLVEIVTRNSGAHIVHGLGAGRWPTTAAVIADLLDLVNEAEPVASAGSKADSVKSVSSVNSVDSFIKT